MNPLILFPHRHRLSVPHRLQLSKPSRRCADGDDDAGDVGEGEGGGEGEQGGAEAFLAYAALS